MIDHADWLGGGYGSVDPRSVKVPGRPSRPEKVSSRSLTLQDLVLAMDQDLFEVSESGRPPLLATFGCATNDGKTISCSSRGDAKGSVRGPCGACHDREYEFSARAKEMTAGCILLDAAWSTS